MLQFSRNLHSNTKNSFRLTPRRKVEFSCNSLNAALTRPLYTIAILNWSVRKWAVHAPCTVHVYVHPYVRITQVFVVAQRLSTLRVFEFSQRRSSPTSSTTYIQGYSLNLSKWREVRKEKLEGQRNTCQQVPRKGRKRREIGSTASRTERLRN